MRLHVALLLCLAPACSPPEPMGTHGAALAAPAWMGNAIYVISRGCSGIPCAMDQRALADGYVYDDWAWSRAVTTSARFEVWQPGVTDWDNPDLWRQLDVRLYWRVGGQGEFNWQWIDFAGRSGNNASYVFSLRALDPFSDPQRPGRKSIQTAADCPTLPFRVSADGGTLEIDVELYVTVNGAELRPAPSVAFHGAYQTTMVTPGVCRPAATTTVDQTGKVVQVLQAWLGDRVTGSEQGPSLGGTRFDSNACTGDDCTAPAEQALELAGAPATSPMIAPFHYTQILSGACEMLEIRTVTRTAALGASTFAGIGFYYTGMRNDGPIFFVTKNRLHAVGQVTLVDGSPAVVHRFLAPGMCFGTGGNTSSILRRSYQFKPFARFDVDPSATEYRVWDDVSDNYLLARARDGIGFVQSFDRQAELLR